MLERKSIRIFFSGNRWRLCISAAFCCIPLLVCILYCVGCGGKLKDVYLPASWWNDELFYYMQVKGILHRGCPQGYFGFNESCARICSFGVWNPLLFLPWVIWGGFGWNLYSPILCNLVCVTVGLAVFVWLAAPNRRQALSIAVMITVFTPFARFILSSVAEAFLLSIVLVYAGLFCAYRRERKPPYFHALLCLAVFLTIIRPYFCLFILLSEIGLSGKGLRRRFRSACGAVLGLMGYWVMKYWFSAPYLFHHIGGGFLETLQQEGVAAGFRALVVQTRDSLINLINLLKDALRYGRQGGCLYGLFGCLGVCFLLILLRERRRGRTEHVRLAAGMVLIYILMMAAIVYVYNIHNGDRHLLSFILLGILFLGIYSGEWMGVILRALLTVTMVFFFFVRPGTDYDRMIPFKEETLQQEVSRLEEQLADSMELSEGLSWNNTVIWLAYDMVDGEYVSEQWQLLYALPAGFGINHCSQDYVLNNFDSIRSRYIAAVPGGEVEKRLTESGAVLLAGNDDISIWDKGRTE